MIKYRTGYDKIEAIDVIRETEKFVFINGWGGKERREAKRADWVNWHDSWEAAHAFIVAKEEKEIESLRSRLERAKGKLGQIKGMKPAATETK